MNTIPVGIVGASGYTGIELTRLVAGHARLELRFVTSDRWGGETVEQRVPVSGRVGKLAYSPQEQAEALSRDCAVVFLATPADVSLQLAPTLLAQGAKVIDLSGAFRLSEAGDYPKYYGFAHHQPQWLAQAVYGLPELFRADIVQAKLLANPGCYATAATLSLAPLLSAGLIEPDSVVINAASGVTGAGRKASEEYSFCELEGDFRAYRVFKHQHTPEIAQTLGRCAKAEVPIAFTPHLLPIRRGILCTTFARLKQGISSAAVADAMSQAYRAEPFVSLAAGPEQVQLKQVVGTNRCQLGFAVDPDHPRRLLVMAAIDNLVKGAAGQAVHNLNLMMGVEETEGLQQLRGHHP